jgi:hypothetical protein
MQVASFIENEFVHEHAEIIRHVSGLTNNLKRLLADATDTSLSVFLFDQSLKH